VDNADGFQDLLTPDSLGGTVPYIDTRREVATEWAASSSQTFGRHRQSYYQDRDWASHTRDHRIVPTRDHRIVPERDHRIVHESTACAQSHASQATASAGRPQAILPGMCIGCAMAATSAATGLRTWLQTRGFSWLTPRRMRALTVAAMSAAAIVSTVGISGTTPPSSHAAASAPVRSAR
jgi:hypothetical protein